MSHLTKPRGGGGAMSKEGYVTSSCSARRWRSSKELILVAAVSWHSGPLPTYLTRPPFPSLMTRRCLRYVHTVCTVHTVLALVGAQLSAPVNKTKIPHPHSRGGGVLWNGALIYPCSYTRENHEFFTSFLKNKYIRMRCSQLALQMKNILHTSFSNTLF